MLGDTHVNQLVSMDKVIMVNENDEVLGTVPKEEAHRKGIPHRIAVTYVENGKGKFLVQVRMDGTLDHSSAGHVDPGETYEEAARRELSEELGIRGAKLKKIGHSMSINERARDGLNRTHIFDVFSCVAEPGQLQADEVKDVYWADPEEVLRDMTSGQSGAEYAGAFLVSLPLYIKTRGI